MSQVNTPLLSPQVIVSGKLCLNHQHRVHARACSYSKRVLDTMSRFTYIKSAYDGFKDWMNEGSQNTKALKRYIHRHLALPKTALHPPDKRDAATEILLQFAFHYINSLLIYCSDDIKDGK